MIEERIFLVSLPQKFISSKEIAFFMKHQKYTQRPFNIFLFALSTSEDLMESR